MKILGFYITRTDWESLFNYERKCRNIEREWALDMSKRLRKIQGEQSETYTDKSGRLRFKHNGQFAPDNRSKFKQTHDQLRAEQAYNWNDIKGAGK